MKEQLLTNERQTLNAIFFKYRSYKLRTMLSDKYADKKDTDIKKYKSYLEAIDMILDHMKPNSRFILKEVFIQNKSIRDIPTSRSNYYRILKASIKEFFELTGGKI